MHLKDRYPLRGDLPWRNIFISTDLFGSNFIDGDDVSGGEVDPGLRAAEAQEWLVSSRRIGSPRELTWFDFLMATMLRRHDSYWSDTSGFWDQLDTLSPSVDLVPQPPG